MAIVRDCGDFSAKVGFTLGVEFPPWATDEQKREISVKTEGFIALLQQRREKLELELLDFFCDQLGYPEDRVRTLIDTRTTEQNDAIEQEKVGRAEKNRRRSGQ